MQQQHQSMIFRKCFTVIFIYCGLNSFPGKLLINVWAKMQTDTLSSSTSYNSSRCTASGHLVISRLSAMQDRIADTGNSLLMSWQQPCTSPTTNASWSIGFNLRAVKDMQQSVGYRFW